MSIFNKHLRSICCCKQLEQVD